MAEVVVVATMRASERTVDSVLAAIKAVAADQASLLAEPPQVHFLQAVPAGHEEKGRI